MENFFDNENSEGSAFTGIDDNYDDIVSIAAGLAEDSGEGDIKGFFANNETPEQQHEEKQAEAQAEAGSNNFEHQETPARQDEPSISFPSLSNPIPESSQQPQFVSSEQYEPEIRQEETPAQQEASDFDVSDLHFDATDFSENVQKVDEIVEVEEKTEPESVVQESIEEPIIEPVKQETPEPEQHSTISKETASNVEEVSENQVDPSNIAKILQISDAYRKLSPEEKKTSSRFINRGKVVAEESEYIYGVLRVDPMLPKTMNALMEAKSLDDIDISFFLMDLDLDLLYSIGNLVEVLNSEEIEKEGVTQNRYAKKLVTSIKKLNDKALGFVEATQSVLLPVLPE